MTCPCCGDDTATWNTIGSLVCLSCPWEEDDEPPTDETPLDGAEDP